MNFTYAQSKGKSILEQELMEEYDAISKKHMEHRIEGVSCVALSADEFEDMRMVLESILDPYGKTPYHGDWFWYRGIKYLKMEIS